MDYKLKIESLGVEITLWENTLDEMKIIVESKSLKKLALKDARFINDKGLSIPIIIDGKKGFIFSCVVSEDKPKEFKFTKPNPRVKTFKGVLKDMKTGVNEGIKFDLQQEEDV